MKKTLLGDIADFTYNGEGKFTYIYFITCNASKHDHFNHVKIGFSKNPKRRMTDLQVGNPNPLYLWYAIKINDEEKVHLERVLHQAFRWHRCKKRNEWFKIRPHIRKFIAAHKSLIGYTKKDFDYMISTVSLKM